MKPPSNRERGIRIRAAAKERRIPGVSPASACAKGACNHISVRDFCDRWLTPFPDLGQAKLVEGNTQIGLGGLGGEDAIGIIWRGRVDQPAGFAAGQWATLQLANRVAHLTRNGRNFHDNTAGYALDNAFHYSGQTFPTGETDPQSDAPRDDLDPEARNQSLSYQMQLLQMYLPPGNRSQWVPLAEIDWQFSVAVTRPSLTDPWQVTGAAPAPQVKGPPADEPTWSSILLNGKRPWVDD